MKITFISNFLTHHQIPFSNEMYKLLDKDYTFISTVPMDDERANMGWKIESKYPYELRVYESDLNKEKAIKLANESDIVIIGSAPDSFISKRLKDRKLTFKYSERLYKEGLSIKQLPRAICGAWIHHGRFQKYPLYMLCASSYTAGDLNIFRNYKNRTFKWAYFPETKTYDIDRLLMLKENNIVEILWVGRLIEWKHAEHAIEIIKKLNDEKYKFHLNIIGIGNCQERLKKLVKEYNLTEKVTFVGAIHADKVREYMEKSNIYLFTSDFNEGWGAVLNEAMNSGCAVVASHAIGSVPFLLRHGENGLIYKYGDMDDFYKQVKQLMEDKDLQKKLGINAYKTIRDSWNAKIGASRFLKLAESLLNGEKCIFHNGPCSEAMAIRQNDMYNYIVKE